jgi:hypothetical protein
MNLRPVWAAILLIGVTAIVYDTIGGLRTVVFSDFTPGSFLKIKDPTNTTTTPTTTVMSSMIF